MKLIFQGGDSLIGLAVLVGALAALLVANGVWQLTRRRRRVGLLSVAAGTGIIVPALLIDSAIRRRQGDRLGAANSFLAAAVLTAVACVAAVLLALSPRTATLWAVVTAWAVLVAVGVFYVPAYGPLGRKRLTSLLTLRCLAIAALIGMLFRPAVSFSPSGEDAKAVLVILMDRSASMAAIDPGAPGRRYDRGVRALERQLGKLRRRFKVVWHPFAGTLGEPVSVKELAAMNPDGDATDLAKAIRMAGEYHREEPLAAMILVTEGIHTGADSPIVAAGRETVPIHPLIAGDRPGDLGDAGANVRIVETDSPLEALNNNQCRLSVRVLAEKMANRAVKVVLTDEEGKVEYTSATFTPATDRLDKQVSLTFTPSAANAPADRADIRRLTVRAVQAGDTQAADNVAKVHMFVTEPNVRVLYVGAIRPEYKYLSRLLRRDPEVQLMTLVQVTKTTFSGEGQIDGRTLSHLPQSTEELDLFDVVILGDVDSRVWGEARLALLGEFVRSGKGLLMLGGRRTFGPGGYGATPLQAVLPVECGPRTIGQVTAPFVPQLTASGLASELLAGTEEFLLGPGGKAPTASLPALTGCVRTAGLRAGATALAIHPTARNGQDNVIVLATLSVGGGRAVAFTADTTWRWHLQLEGAGKDSPFARFWRQMVHYLASQDVEREDSIPGVVGRAPRQFVEIDQLVDVSAAVHDTDGPAAKATVLVVATPAGSEDPERDSQSFTLEPADRPGQYTGNFTPAGRGRYILRFTATDDADAALGTDTLPLIVAGAGGEDERTNRIAADDQLLAGIARASDGRLRYVEAAPETVDELLRAAPDEAALAQAGMVPLYDFTAGFLAFVALITLEWFLRRRWQMR